MPTNYYDILGVKKDADTAQIKTAFKKLSLIWHPDKLTSDMPRPKLTPEQEAIYASIEKASVDKSKVYENYYKELVMAHETLCDTHKRKEHDLTLSSDDAAGSSYNASSFAFNRPFDAKFSSFDFFQSGGKEDDYTPKQCNESEWFPLEEIECTKAEMKRYSPTVLGISGAGSQFGTDFYGGFYNPGFRFCDVTRIPYMVVTFWNFDCPSTKTTKANLLKRWTEDPQYGMNIHKIKTLPRNRIFTHQEWLADLPRQDSPSVVIEDVLEIYKLLQMLKRENMMYSYKLVGNNCKGPLCQLDELEEIITLTVEKTGIPTYRSWRKTVCKELIRIASLSKPKSSILSYFQTKAEAQLIDQLIEDLGDNRCIKLGSSYEFWSWDKPFGRYLKDLQKSHKALYQNSKVLPKLFRTLLEQEREMMAVDKVSMLKQEHKHIFHHG